MPEILATVVLPHVSGIVADEDENSFVFQTGGSALGLANALEAATVLQRFYNHVGGGAFRVSSFISPAVSRAVDACRVEYYDISAHLDGSAHGSPILTSTWTLLAPEEDLQLPNEVAGVLTLYGSGRAAAPVSIPNPTPPPLKLRPKQSHTGRLYIGPLTPQALGVVGGECFLGDGFTGQVMAAGRQLIIDTSALEFGDAAWSVWSRKLAMVDLIVGGAMDNAPDTQRRRGVAPTSRVTW
jgi:hypothetical protein